MECTQWTVIIAAGVATVFAPLIALWVQRRGDKDQRDIDLRLNVFRTLMATRASVMDPKHVSALNTIDVVFGTDSGSDRSVREAWNVYLSHLKDRNYPEQTRLQRGRELLTELLARMGTSLGFKYDRAHIANNGYYPDGYATATAFNIGIRTGLLQVLSGERAIPVVLREDAARAPVPNAPEEGQATPPIGQQLGRPP